MAEEANPITSVSEQYVAMPIMCDNTDIMCDSTRYYCNGHLIHTEESDPTTSTTEEADPS